MASKKVFIGHGRSPVWRELKDFLRDRLFLDFEEFNRVTPAGVATPSRLEEMLNSAAFAFLIMTAEDEQLGGEFNARLNVIHEAGLFQGKLGFRKAIILLEEGCEEFSNIHGLGRIHFPKGNIKATFEEVRQVLERECITQGRPVWAAGDSHSDAWNTSKSISSSTPTSGGFLGSSLGNLDDEKPF